jgi:hypothetical protein
MILDAALHAITQDPLSSVIGLTVTGAVLIAIHLVREG